MAGTAAHFGVHSVKTVFHAEVRIVADDVGLDHIHDPVVPVFRGLGQKQKLQPRLVTHADRRLLQIVFRNLCVKYGGYEDRDEIIRTDHPVVLRFNDGGLFAGKHQTEIHQRFQHRPGGDDQTFQKEDKLRHAGGSADFQGQGVGLGLQGAVPHDVNEIQCFPDRQQLQHGAGQIVGIAVASDDGVLEFVGGSTLAVIREARKHFSGILIDR